MTNETATALHQVRSTFLKNIAALESAIASNKPGALVFAWSQYGLGVLIDAEGCRVVGIDRATIVRANDRRSFLNGANVAAVIVDRAQALADALASVRKTLAQIDEHNPA